jgi:4-coumarate--CoA ligase
MIPPPASLQEYNAAPRSYILHSRWSCSIPTTDLCSWLFTSATFPLPHSPAIYISADNPSRQSISLHGFRSLVLRIARGLRKVGLEPGQRVLTISSNNVFYPALFLGIIAAGGVFTGANPSYTPRELAVQLRDSGATFCVVGDAVVETVVKAAGMVVGLDKRNIFIFDESLVENERCWETDGINLAKQHSVRHWSEFVSPTDDFIWTVFTTAKQADTIAAINYSSG